MSVRHGLADLGRMIIGRLTRCVVDPWFNFRATKYLVNNGFYPFWDWFDDRTRLPHIFLTTIPYTYTLPCRNMAPSRACYRRHPLPRPDGHLRRDLPPPPPPNLPRRHPQHLCPPRTRLLRPHRLRDLPVHLRNERLSFCRPLSSHIHGHHTRLYLSKCSRKLRQ